MALLEVRDLVRRFRMPDGQTQTVVDVPSFDVEAGEEVAIHGESGAGKTTFLHMIAGLLRPDAGVVRIDGVELSALGEAARDRFRARNLGYVFQSFHLLQGYTALENVVLGQAFGAGVDRARARELLERLGMAERLAHRPRALSVGQQQRVALARAVANRPKLVLADEPTGNLDARHGLEALELLREVCREEQAALLLVSHDQAVLDRFERVVDLAELNRAAQGAES